MNVKMAVKKINEIGKHCWLQTGAAIATFNPPRGSRGEPLGRTAESEGTPMNRFMFMADAFTSLDAEIMPDGKLRIMFNNHFENQYPEDAAFAIPELAVGQLVDPKVLVANTRIYVGIANQRAKYPVGEIVRKLPPHLRRKLNLRSSVFDVKRLEEQATAK